MLYTFLAKIRNLQRYKKYNKMHTHDILHSQTIKVWGATILASTVNLVGYIENEHYLFVKEILPTISWVVTIAYTCVKLVQLVRKKNESK